MIKYVCDCGNEMCADAEQSIFFSVDVHNNVCLNCTKCGDSVCVIDSSELGFSLSIN